MNGISVSAVEAEKLNNIAIHTFFRQKLYNMRQYKKSQFLVDRFITDH